MADIHEVPNKKPLSSAAMVEILRGLIDSAFDREMTFLEVCAIIDGQKFAVSIGTRKDND